MTAEEIVPGIYAIPVGSIVNAFAIVDGGVTLIDTGTAKGADKIRTALRDDIKHTRIDNVALTHHHPDHRGGASILRGDANVYVHSLDAPVVRGDREPPGPSVGGLLRIVVTVVRPLVDIISGNPQPVMVHKEVAEGDEVPGGLKAIHTPGHTAGHVSYLHEGKRVLFVGDAAQHRSKLALPPPFFTEDMAQAKRTLGKIAELDFDTAVFGHGTVLRGKANTEFRKLVDQLAR
jgi:glyoxylase-like metal-dependent hydrolase (beta-lactamase superfamily II)